MTKRILFIFMMMMLGITTTSAQSIIGKWSADEEFIKKMELEEKDGKVEVILNITNNAIGIDVLMNLKEDDDKMDIIYNIPGTYTKSGKKVTAKFDKTKATLKVTDIMTNDPELKELLKTAEGKKMVLELVNSMMQSALKDAMKELGEISTIFTTFTIKQVTAKTLLLSSAEIEEMNFKRK